MTDRLKLAETKIHERVGEDIVVNTPPEQLTEPRGNYKNFATRVIKPKNTNQVSTVLATLNEHKIGVIPYSGGTGLVGGQMAPHSDFFLLSLEKMQALRDFSEADGVLVVESGMILSKVHEEALRINRKFPLSLASEGTCQIGGNLATNAGGINVIRYGSARNLCLGVEAVFADGTIYNGLASLIKDNSGYDIRNLLIGSEGTLGVITAASLKTFPLSDEKVVSMIKVESPGKAVMLLNQFQQVFENHIQAYELLSRKGLEFLNKGHFTFKEPFVERGDWMVLIEISGSKLFDLSRIFQDVLYKALRENWVIDAVIAQNETQEKELWQIRENMSEANRQIGAIFSSDVSVPISQISNFVFEAEKRVKKVSSELQINCFGHLGDGNMHFNVFPPFGKNKYDFKHLKNDVGDAIHEVASKLNGSFSAEHGIGRLKVMDLEKYGDVGKLQFMKLIKSALDPNFILNPGVIISEC